MEEARSLTGARFGVFLLLDDQRQFEHSLASGMTEDEARLLWGTPDRIQMCERLMDSDEPVRVGDFVGLLGELGFPEFRSPVPVEGPVAFMATPVRHGSEPVAHIFVADREEGLEFTVEDEETLVLW